MDNLENFRRSSAINLIEKYLSLDSAFIEDDSISQSLQSDPDYLNLLSFFDIEFDRLVGMIVNKSEKDLIFTNCFGGNFDKRQEPVIEDDIKLDTILIIIQISDESYFNHIQKEYNQNTLKIIFLKAFKFVTSKMDDGILESIFADTQEDHFKLFASIVATEKKGGGSSDTPLLPDKFKYEMLPHSVVIKIMTQNRNFLYEKHNYKVKVEKVNEKDKVQFLDEKERKRWKQEQYFRKKRFIKFLKYFRDGRMTYAAIDREDLLRAKQNLDKKFIGIQDFTATLLDQMDLFGSDIFSHPKGMIWYGPPGTGKSAISHRLCIKSGMVFVTQPLAAGDVKKGIVGDTELTINAIADRARLIPWDTAVILIDEIDSLVPSRDDQKNQNSSGNNDAIGVLLSIMDGIKVVKNLKVMGSTNLLLNIDAAIRRRLDIQVFLGNPSRSQREQWIVQKKSIVDKKYQYKRNDGFYIQFNQLIGINRIRELIINSTLNFSADAYRKVIEGFFDILLSRTVQQDKCEKILIGKIQSVSRESNIIFGSLLVVDVLQQKHDLEPYFDILSFNRLMRVAQTNQYVERGVISKYTKRMLINVRADIQNFQDFIQIERQEKVEWNQIDEHLYQRLLNAITSNNDDNLNFKLLICLFLHYSNIPYRISRFNEIRLAILIEMRRKFPRPNDKNLAMKFLLQENNFDLPDLEDFVAQMFGLFANLYGENIERNAINVIRTMATEYFEEINYAKRPKCFVDDLKIFNDQNILSKGWKYLMLKFTEQYDADMVVLIDSYYLEQNKASEDKEVSSLIYKIISDMKKYSKCVIIFDLDSISFIKEEYSGLKEHLQAPSLEGLQRFNNNATFNYNIQRQIALNQTLDLIANADPEGNIWYVAVSSHNKIILDYRIKMQWPKSQSILNYEEEELKKDEEYLCRVCLEIFTKRDNQGTEFKCKIHENHDQFFYEDGNIKRRVVYQEAKRLIEKDSKLPTMFKHTCCGGTVGSKGCRSTRHDEASDRYQRDQMTQEHARQLGNSLINHRN